MVDPYSIKEKKNAVEVSQFETTEKSIFAVMDIFTQCLRKKNAYTITDNAY